MSVYACRRCNYEQPEIWEGLCPGCKGPYRSKKIGADTAEQKARATFGTTVKVKRERVPTTVEGFDRVTSGGLRPGCVMLLGGFPGAGKSTLLCLVADGIARTKGTVIYASAEESAEAVQEIAANLGLVNDKVEVLGNQRSVEKVIARAKELHAWLIIFDSAQKFASDFSGGASGSVVQNKAIGETISAYCRETKTSAVIVNQMSNSGDLKGGTELEHNCDTVAVLAPPKDDDDEAPEGRKIRILVIVKNRGGDENLKSYWKMHGEEDPHPGMLECVPAREKIVSISSRRRRHR